VPEQFVRANGTISATNLFVRRGFGEGPIVALNAHGDAVPPGEGWTHDPVEQRLSTRPRVGPTPSAPANENKALIEAPITA